MPIGRVHKKIWKRYIVIAVPLALSIQYYTITRLPLGWWQSVGVATILGYLLGYYLDPDYDQNKFTDARRRVINDLWIIGWLLVVWFIPYEKMFKHRSKYTHFPILSTVLRFGWLLLFPPVLLLLWYTTPYLIPDYYPILVGIFIGLSIADTVHILADYGVLNE